MKNIKSVFLTCGVRSGAALLTRMLSVSDEFKASSATVNFFRFFYKKYDPLQNKKNLSRAISDAHIRLKYRFDIDIDKSEIYSFFRKNSKTSRSSLLTPSESDMTSLRKSLLKCPSLSPVTVLVTARGI